MSITTAAFVTLLDRYGPVLTQLIAAPTAPATLTAKVPVARATVD